MRVLGPFDPGALYNAPLLFGGVRGMPRFVRTRRYDPSIPVTYRCQGERNTSRAYFLCSLVHVMTPT